MIACLRAARFQFPDDSASVFIELRRHGAGSMPGEKQFVVSERMPKVNMIRNINKGTYNEAVAEWSSLVQKWADLGLRRNDPIIMGFHEEG
jgi:hypothetical protein